jgi:hypothetical protein
MRRGHGIHVIGLAVGGVALLESRPIPAGKTNFSVEDLGVPGDVDL